MVALRGLFLIVVVLNSTLAEIKATDNERVPRRILSSADGSDWCDSKDSSGTHNLRSDCPVPISISRCIIGGRAHDTAVCVDKGTLEINGIPSYNGTLPKIYRPTLNASTGEENAPYRLFTLSGNSILRIKTLVLEGGDATPSARGGAVYTFGPSTLFQALDCGLFGNTAEMGGAVFTELGVVDIQGTEIKGNTALLWGGGLVCGEDSFCNVTGAASALRQNTAAFSGGGIMCMHGAECYILQQSSVEENAGGYYGGGIVCEGVGTVCRVASGAIVQFNVAKLSVGLKCNGAVCTTDSTAFSKYCRAGTYGTSLPLDISASATASSGSCTDCPTGKFGDRESAKFGDVQTGCKHTKETCPAGHYCPGLQGATIPCPPASYGNVHGKASLAAACPSLCPPGKFGPLAGQLTESKACVDCVEGSYGNIVGQRSSCANMCAKGRYGNVRGKTKEVEACGSLCPKGRYGHVDGGSTLDNACLLCPPGAYATQEGQAGECLSKCTPGKFGAARGQATEASACAMCPAGFYSSVVGQPNQCDRACAPGKFGNVQGQTTEKAACTHLCPAGKWGVTLGASSEGAACPKLCPKGKFGTGAGHTSEASACSQQCPPGKFGKAEGKGSEDEACAVCSFGKVSTKAGVESCTDCPAGSALPDDGATSALHDEVTDCLTCLGGEYSATGSQLCVGCLPGKFLEDPGTSTKLHAAESFCRTCPSGSWNIVPSASTCVACTPPSRCLGGDTCLRGRAGFACIDCSKEKGAQYYSTDEGKTCIPCPESNTGPIIAGVLVVMGVCGTLYFTLAERDRRKDNVDASQFFAREHTLSSQVSVSLYKDEDVSGLHAMIDMADQNLNEDGQKIEDDSNAFSVTLKRGPVGMKLGHGLVVEGIKEGSAANDEGIECGDILWQMNGEDLLNQTPEAVNQQIKAALEEKSPSLRLTFRRPLDLSESIRIDTALQNAATESRRWFLIDVGSTNGTFIDDKAIMADKPIRVRLGMEIGVGSTTLKLTSWNCLEVIEGPHEGETFTIPEKNKTLVTLGRASQAKQCGAVLASLQAHKKQQKENEENTMYNLIKKIKQKMSTKKNKQGDFDVKRLTKKLGGGKASQANVLGRSISRTFNIVSAHTITLSFSLPEFDLIHLPPWLKSWLASMMEVFAVDLSGLTSSPECAWELSTPDTYMLKMALPALLLLFFIGWLFASHIYYSWSLEMSDFDADETIRQRRASKNRILAVAFYLWCVTVYALTLQQVLSGINCTSGQGGLSRLTMDSEIVCVLEPGSKWVSIFILSATLFFFYCLLPVLLAARVVFNWDGRCCKTQAKIPVFVNPAHCPQKTFDGAPCYECELCDKRQRFAWVFEKYRPESYYWEAVVLFRKLLIGLATLFLATKKALLYPLIIAFNSLIFVVTVVRQPYLGDAEEISTVALKKKRRCTWKSCGSNNILDSSLMFSEVLLGIAALANGAITESLAADGHFTLSADGAVGNGTALVSNSTGTTMANREDLFKTHYPGADIVLSIIEWIAIVVIIGSMILLVKEMMNAGFEKVKSFWHTRQLRIARRQQAGEVLSASIKSASDITTVDTRHMNAAEAEMQNYEDAQELKEQMQGQKKLDAKERLARRLKKQKNKK
jgi:hypothetical protein